jgi:hypothetical protein
MPFDPAFTPTEKLNVAAGEAPALDPAELKRRIAALVRAASAERRTPAQEHEVAALDEELPPARRSALLAEMAEDPAYADIKAVVAPSGRVYLFSEPALDRNAAVARSRVEESKLAIVEKIRGDSLYVALTPLADLGPLFHSADPAERAALLAELQADPRFQDIQQLAGADGEPWFHSDTHLSGNYGRIMLRARAGDPALSIAELVRDRSRVMPAPTRVTVFQDRVFELSREQLDAFVDGLGKPGADPGYADIRRLVHPETGAVYLYSDRWMLEVDAVRVMDWEEVGQARNP